MLVFEILKKIRIKKWIDNGAKIGKNFKLERNSYLDSSFPWLIEIGDNVTIAPDVLILSHDGSTKNVIGYSKCGNVSIGNNVFIGAKSVILPNTRIGNNVIIGSNSVVSGNIPENTVIAGSPAKILMNIEQFEAKHKEMIKQGKKYEKDFTKKGKISNVDKKKMKKELEENKNGYVV